MSVKLLLKLLLARALNKLRDQIPLCIVKKLNSNILAHPWGAEFLSIPGASH